MKSRRFVDTVTLYAKAGDGGNGCASFRREKYVPRGGPDGGDGGNGGHVILRADPDITSLEHIFFAPHQRATSGGRGKGKQLYGRNADNLVVRVPCGTEVHDNETGVMVADIVEPGSEVIVAKGGKGGKGNIHWKSATHQAPMEHTAGEPGEDTVLRLYLKIISDFGLVGFPNAGKSSLLTCLSDAHPRVAAYPFTTLNPIVGTLIFEDYVRATIADIPGLIEGAHEGVGLGHAFLRHIERAAALIFVVDMGAVDGRDPVSDFENLKKELRLHDESLAKRPSLVVANKMDVPQAQENLIAFHDATGLDPLCVSTLSNDGIDALKEAIHKLFLQQRQEHANP